MLDQLMLHEGLRLKPYRDTVGKLTIGIGRNLDDVGISRDEALVLCENDIATAERELDRVAPWWRNLNDARRRVLIDMMFNLGANRLLGFKHSLAAMQAGRFELAASGMLESKWAEQVGKRATRLAIMMKTGEVPA